VRNFAFFSTATKRVIHPLGHGRRHTEDSWRLRIASSAVSLAAPFYGTIKLQSPSASGAYLIVSRSASAKGNEEGVVGLVGYCKAFVTVRLLGALRGNDRRNSSLLPGRSDLLRCLDSFISVSVVMVSRE